MLERMRPSGMPERQFYGFLTSAVQRSRIRAITEYVDRAGAVLDAGCGWTPIPSLVNEYTGCDRDPLVLEEARRRFPERQFFEWDFNASEPPAELIARGPFDTIFFLAVLEHVSDPPAVLGRLARLLSSSGRLIVTTPHPMGRLPLEIGARLGLLSRHAHEEHECLLGRQQLQKTGVSAGLRMQVYRRFLFQLNQLAVFGR
jgi:2-polyprenyl-3-methyl-5-hydroxy-6-metoxy-1,4-benzoquinol methylase